MTNLQLIKSAEKCTLAKFLHTLQAGAIIEGKADSTEELIKWLEEDVEEEGNEDGTFEN